MECVLPGCPNAEAWVARGRAGAHAITVPPSGRWPIEPPISAAPAPPDRTVSARGGFVDGFRFDPAGLELDVDPIAIDPMLGWVLHTARGALAGSRVARARVDLLVASLNLPTSGAVRAWARVRGVSESPWLAGGRPEALHHGHLPATLSAKALGLGGLAMCLDAACASSLYAVALATDRLAAGLCDEAVVVGVNGADPSYLSIGFSQLRALSPSGIPRPFDRRADGLVVGEGAASVRIKRLSDAVEAGDPVLAVIRGVAMGNDGRKGNLLAPDRAGQLRTLKAAWGRAGLDPSLLGYVECHATGTPVGDPVEAEALAALLGETRPRRAIALSSSKALIGHTITAAGIASLIRAVGAIRDGFRPAAHGVEDPIDLDPRLTLLPAPDEWEGERVAAVSAFGFGGTNAHVVLGPGQAGAVPATRTVRRFAVAGASARVGDPTLDDVSIDAEAVRVSPAQLSAMLPQQALAVSTAVEALAACDLAGTETAVVIGIGLDPRIADHVLRWTAGTTDAEPLTSDRVQGSLPNLVANRISALHDLRGPSLTVGAGPRTVEAVLAIAGRLLANGAPAVVAGVSDVSGKTEGAVTVVLRSLESGDRSLEFGDRSLDCDFVGGFVKLLAERGIEAAAPRSLGPTRVRLSRGLPAPGWSGSFQPSGPLPVPTPGRGPGAVRFPAGAEPCELPPLSWPYAHPAVVAKRAVPPAFMAEAAALVELAAAMARSQEAAADAHGIWLAQEAEALAQIGRLEAMLRGALPAAQAPSVAAARASSAAPTSASIVVATPVARGVAGGPLFDGDALLAHAGGRLSDVFGQPYADLDAFEPRVRMPLPPLLLCSRVVALEGKRGTLGPSRIVTEYDLPRDAWWSHDGKAPPCVVVESGQADLFLVSYLGVDAQCRGNRRYRLLDCDLTFHGPRPELGVTLRHDIRIRRFATLGDLLLFYFEYDATRTDTGEVVLTMRNGCAGFFTSEELSDPTGLVIDATEPVAERFEPPIPGAPDALDEAALAALTEGRLSAALGASFAGSDGTSLRLPSSRFRMVHRVRDLAFRGGAYGLGGLVAEQDLSDDDWFNPCHFLGDPCMPGTLMFDGCCQALQTWLLAAGFADRVERDGATFEPVAELATRLRCRGQIAPGHRSATYEVRVKRVTSEPLPEVVADVVLSVDGRPVVHAMDVGARIAGRPRAHHHVARGPAAAASPEIAFVSPARVMEFSVGDPSRAFGGAFAEYDARRCPRMPGPPLLFISGVDRVEGPCGVVSAGRSLTATWLNPPDAWYWAADPGQPMAFAILLEVALQPCGWLTAWQGSCTRNCGDVYFRNLGGTATVHRDVWPDTGPLTIEATQTSVSEAAGMTLHFFDFRVCAGSELVFSGTTHFGYFGPDSLLAQKGLPAADSGPIAEVRPIELATEPAMPRADLLMLHRVTHADETAGASELGRYRAERDISPRDWYFAAHFFQDPVMPGSLGLEALVQLMRWVWTRRVGVPGTVRLGTEGALTWRYRGQVLPTRKRMTAEVEVLELSAEDGTLQAKGRIAADGVDIYELEGVSLRFDERRPPQPRAVAVVRRARPPAALLDAFTANGDTGHGVLRLDPDVHPWLADHCPTLTAPALPMAFAAEIAAEAALQMRPGSRVVAVPSLTAERWIHCGDGPLDLLVTAVAEGDTVAVTLAVHHENPRFPKLSGPVVHMRAVVRVGSEYAAPERAPDLRGLSRVELSAAEYYGGCHTFHGPTLQGMIDLGTRGPRGARSTFRTRPDEDLAPGRPAFALDPLLLDTATHPMMSSRPEVWNAAIPAGMLAYPVRAGGLRLFGPRPEGEVRCVLSLVEATAKALVFDVWLEGWCAFRWEEALVPAGPLLGHPPDVRKAFLLDELPNPDVVVGRSTTGGWEVRASDLVEPLPGTLVSLFCSPGEVASWRASADRDGWALTHMAAKGAVRHHLRERVGRDIHPRRLHLLRMRDDLFVVLEAGTLTAAEYIDHLGPTSTAIRVTGEGDVRVARVDGRATAT